MKRFLSCLMALVLLLCVVGCGAIEFEPTLPKVEPIITETVPAEQVKWEVPGETYEIDITHEAETDLEKIAWVIYMEAGADSVCDDCRRRVADVILNLTECKITNTGNDLYWPDTITGVISGGGIQGHVLHRTLLHLGHAVGDADNHLRPAHDGVAGDLLEVMSQHGGGDIELCDDPVLQGAHGHDGTGGFPQHHFGFAAHGHHSAAFGFHGHHRRFSQGDSPSFHVHQRIGGTQVNADAFHV